MEILRVLKFVEKTKSTEGLLSLGPNPTYEAGTTPTLNIFAKCLFLRLQKLFKTWSAASCWLFFQVQRLWKRKTPDDTLKLSSSSPSTINIPVKPIQFVLRHETAPSFDFSIPLSSSMSSDSLMIAKRVSCWGSMGRKRDHRILHIRLPLVNAEDYFYSHQRREFSL